MKEFVWNDEQVCNFLQYVQGLHCKVNDSKTFDITVELFKDIVTRGLHWKLLEGNSTDGHTKVLRLSDGVIFSIGDYVISRNYNTLVEGKITKLVLAGSGIMVYTTYSGVGFNLDGFEHHSPRLWYVNNNLEVKISAHRKIPCPSRYVYFTTEEEALNYVRQRTVILTTEDGVDMYYGDCPWYVSGDLKTTGMANPLSNSSYHPAEGNKYFSTEKLRDLYIYNNKKRFSLADVRAALLPDRSYQYHGTTILNLRNTIKD